MAEQSRSVHIGLTGGIGSGKSTVAMMLAELAPRGALAVVDADAQSRQLTAAGGAAVPAIRQLFGGRFVDAQGAMDRAAMRDLVFQDAAAKQKLEALLHPMVGRALAEQVATAEAAGARVVVFDIPLLVESRHWRPRLEAVWVVDCRPQTQLQRVLSRASAAGQPMTEEAVFAILRHQASREQRLAAADAVIANDDLSLDGLRAEASALVAGLL
jgi:dephospho-CoA kinase